ncbi:ADP-ribosylhydrolase ARH1-like, partial [Mercenaria mercenaria]|uniref:ADP-ribosylhydrolase ARH1-like n=1 Tax=Mercenaria mercenaria TaxID=6596 RepID=UPI00234FA09D
MAPLDTRYQAAMVLSGVGDSLGYKNGEWLLCLSGIKIHEELEKLGGVNNTVIKPPEWKASPCTLLNIHTANALTKWEYKNVNDFELTNVAKQYKNTTDAYDMKERHPDETLIAALEKLNPDGDQGPIGPFDSNGISSTAAVRGMCIGLRHPDPVELHALIKLSIEIGRLLNHHPSGFLGTLTTALFTSYALQRKPVQQWGHGLIKTFPKAMSYVKESGIAVKENVNTWSDFEDKWRWYVRRIETEEKCPKFPCPYDIEKKEEFYESISGNERSGSNGCDATIIAYDVFLSFNGSWEDLCIRSICHGGLSNVICSITASWYGAMYGYDGVKECIYSKVEFWSHLKGLAYKLFHQSYYESLLETPKDLAKLENTENPAIT